jgi:hypothetical protein
MANPSLTAVTNLQATYGAPSQAAFGSAVFSEKLGDGANLEQAALAKYRYFVGDLWDRYGEDAWMGPWKEVYARSVEAERNIVAELGSIQDRNAALSPPMIVEVAPYALSAAFDAAEITDLRVYNIGDGEAMSGLLVAGCCSNDGEALFLVLLMD